MKIGFVGFGEAASHIAKGLRGEGIAGFHAYDINTHAPGLGDRICSRAADTATTLVESNAALTSACDLIISYAVTANQVSRCCLADPARPHARGIFTPISIPSLPLLNSRTSTSWISATGARFVEVAVMAPVPPYNHKVPLLVGGAGAQDFFERMTPLGMVMEVTSDKVGEAAAMKLCRSVVIKGMEGLLSECVLTACCYGAAERVFASRRWRPSSIDWADTGDLYDWPRRRVRWGTPRPRDGRGAAETVRDPAASSP